MVGKTLTHYKVLEKLGSGGMGEVYVAEDMKLSRKVALKILPAEMASSERRVRFEREAKAVAALNHPNIVHLYSVEEAEGVHFITMELVQGKTLSELIPEKGLSLNQFLEIAVPLADALSAAHEKGITHRDLKPDNLMVSDEGRLKILDFGLAKLKQKVGSSGISELPTRSATQEGRIVGTLPYMSPEQAEGKPIDHRSDIFSLGIVFYEMLTGRHPFPGDTATAVISSIMKDTPPSVIELKATLPHDLGRITRRCLSKELTRRYQSALDLRNDLEELRQALDSGEIVAAAPPASQAVPARGHERWRQFIPWGVAGLIAILGVAFWLVWTPAPVPRNITRFVIPSPADTFISRMNWALSTDGRRLVYRAGTPRQLYVRNLDRLGVIPLPGTEGGYTPFFSPDGRWVAFGVSNLLKKAALGGGPSVTLCEIEEGIHYCSWGPNGTIFFGGFDSGLWRVSAEGGEPQPVVSCNRDKGEIDVHRPDFLPGGKAVIYTMHTDRGFHIEVVSLASGEHLPLIEPGFDGHYLPTGHIVYASSNTIFAVPFDAVRLEVTEPAVRVLEGVHTQPGDGYAAFRVADNGTLAYMGEAAKGGRRLVWVDRQGIEELLPVDPAAFMYPRLSPDGKQLAVGIEGDRGGSDIWIYDLANNTERRVTFEGSNQAPVWTPDGKQLVFSSDRSGELDLYRVPVDGSAPPQALLTSELRLYAGSFSPDGQTLAVVETDPTDVGDISLLDVRNGGDPWTFIQSPEHERSPQFSPDGKWMAYGSAGQVFVTPYPGPRGRRQVSSGGGHQGTWSRDGGEFFHRQGRRMIGIPVKMTPTLELGKPQILFEGEYVVEQYQWTHDYDVAPDGRFLMIKWSEEELAPPSIHVVLNWFEELIQRVPP